LFHADRWTDGEADRRDGVNSRSSQFCERSKNVGFLNVKPGGTYTNH